jgi:hypothetical protein
VWLTVYDAAENGKGFGDEQLSFGPVELLAFCREVLRIANAPRNACMDCVSYIKGACWLHGVKVRGTTLGRQCFEAKANVVLSGNGETEQQLVGIRDALLTLGITGDSLFARIREDLERGLIRSARTKLNFVDKIVNANAESEVSE